MGGRWRLKKTVSSAPVGKPRKPSVLDKPLDEHSEAMLSRIEVASLLGLGGRTTVRHYEERGELRSIFVNGQHWFTKEEVLRALYARDMRFKEAFARFAAGASPMDVVIELNMNPEQTGRLYAIYVDQCTRFERQKNRLVVQLPDKRSLDEWSRIYRATPADFTAVKLLRALELCLADPGLRAQLDANSQSA